MKNKTHREYLSERVESKALDRELIYRLLTYFHPYRFLLFASVVVLLISKIIEATVPIIIGNMSQKILDSFDLIQPQKAELFKEIFVASFWIIMLLVVSYVFDTVNIALKSWIGQKALYRLRMEVYDQVIRMPIPYFDKETVGRLMTRTIHDVDQINQMFAESIVPILGNLFLFIGIYIGIFAISWKIAFLVSAILPLVWWLTHRFRYAQKCCYDRIRTVVAALNTFVQEHLLGASTIRTFGLQNQVKKKFEEINEDHCNSYLDSIRNFSFFISSMDFLQSFSLIFAFAILIVFSSSDGFHAGTYFTFSLYVLMFFRPLADLAERYNVLQSAMAAASRIFHLLDQPSELNRDLGKKGLEAIETIHFEDVWFAYKEGQWVLKGISFAVNQGDSIALVGMTGEGKSTIINLLMRFYQPQKGAIKINGVNIQEYSLDAIRGHLSLVLQDPVIFSGTIGENISLFNPAIDQQSVEKAIDYLNLHSFIRKFSKGTDHLLKERGKDLSVGEMQLLSMARAVAHSRSLFILDEATANMDLITESLIQRGLKKILENKTCLVIAHRLKTVEEVKEILVLHQGTIVESGSHQALLQQRGIYEKLYRLQFV